MRAIEIKLLKPCSLLETNSTVTWCVTDGTIPQSRIFFFFWDLKGLESCLLSLCVGRMRIACWELWFLVEGFLQIVRFLFNSQYAHAFFLPASWFLADDVQE